MTHWNSALPPLDYDPAPREFSLGMARGVLARLYGRALEVVETAGDGACDDCSKVSERVVYGRYTLCRRCASSRRNARTG